MIRTLDEIIKKLLVTEVPLKETEVEISFAVPNREWSQKRSTATINIYLHDIRENLELRPNEREIKRGSNGTISLNKLGRRYDLSYLITAWTVNVEDEHLLLWDVLDTLTRFPFIPDELLPEKLREQQPFPIPTKVAQPDGFLRNAADVWTALDNQLKPVLTYVVTVSQEIRELEKNLKEVRNSYTRFYKPTVERESASQAAINFQLENPQYYGQTDANFTRNLEVPPGMNQFLGIGGRVLNGDDLKLPPIKGAEVHLVEQGLKTFTDEKGQFRFNNVLERPQGYIIMIFKSGFVTIRQELNIPAPFYDYQMQAEPKI